MGVVRGWCCGGALTVVLLGWCWVGALVVWAGTRVGAVISREGVGLAIIIIIIIFQSVQTQNTVEHRTKQVHFFPFISAFHSLVQILLHDVCKNN